ncbi:MAG TPA: hypothetical protein VD838_22555, partial [Anaeromyxobacteraceae bacterium]|nr:hypothetical protein [Anaeromyxobacteraceae bacterium]
MRGSVHTMHCTSTGRTRSTLLLAGLLVACRTVTPAPVERAAPPAPSPTSAAIPRGDDPSLRFFGAYERAQQGDPGAALATLRALDADGWAIPLDPRDWPSLARDPEFDAIAARVAARAPASPRAEVAFTVAETGLVPEGIAHDPGTGALFVGSIRQRKIVRIGPDGAATDFVASAAGGLLAPLGLKVDAARRLLWAASMASRG